MHTHHASRAQHPVTGSQFTQRFSPTRRGARLARLLTLNQLDAWGIPYGSEPSEAAGAIVAELAANAVLHGHVPGRDFAVTLTPPGPSGDLLLVEVTDTRGELWPSPPPPAVPADEDETGRGLLLVATLAADWGVRSRGPHAPGKTVWAAIATETDELTLKMAELA